MPEWEWKEFNDSEILERERERLYDIEIKILDREIGCEKVRSFRMREIG